MGCDASACSPIVLGSPLCRREFQPRPWSSLNVRARFQWSVALPRRAWCWRSWPSRPRRCRCPDRRMRRLGRSRPFRSQAHRSHPGRLRFKRPRAGSTAALGAWPSLPGFARAGCWMLWPQVTMDEDVCFLRYMNAVLLESAPSGRRNGRAPLGGPYAAYRELAQAFGLSRAAFGASPPHASAVPPVRGSDHGDRRAQAGGAGRPMAKGSLVLRTDDWSIFPAAVSAYRLS